MKYSLAFFALFLGLFCSAQEIKKVNSEPTKTCIIPPLEIEDLKIAACYVLPEDWFLQSQIQQPTRINEQPNGTMPLSKELPYVHTIRGAVYTYDHLRYTPR